MFTSACTSSYKTTDLVYFLEVGCSSDYIYVFGSDTMYFSKLNVGLIIVSADIILVLLLVFLLWFEAWNEHKICDEIDDEEITASDFTVEIRDLPLGQQTNQAIFKCQMWQWIEGLCDQYQMDHEQSAPGGEVANNRLMNINFALSDYGRMKMLL
jgi:hypothetical protein